jgi:hypothetical protein
MLPIENHMENKKFVVEFIGHDEVVRRTLPMSKMGANLASCIIPFQSKIVSIEEEQINPKDIKVVQNDERNPGLLERER